MNRLAYGLAAIALLSAGQIHAHDGIVHESEPAASTHAAAPRWLSPTRLQVPKSMQRALQIRTETTATAIPDERILYAEVLPAPASPKTVTAAESGRLEAAQSWPLTGQRVKRGDVLAQLRPLQNLQQASERQRDIALLEQSIEIARINFERLKVQVQASDGVLATNNVYYDEARLDLESLLERHRQALQAIDPALPLRAPEDGVIAEIPVRRGDIVEVGDTLFVLVGTTHQRYAVPLHDPALANAQREYQLLLSSGHRTALRHAGVEPAVGNGWRLLLDGALPDTADIPVPGEFVRVATQGSITGPQCLQHAAGAELWVHVEPEIFERRRHADCAQIQLAATERWVREGAALLGQYR